MPDFFTPDTFDQDKYKKTCWKVSLNEFEMDGYMQRLIVRVATGRKYYPLFTEVINAQLGDKDPALRNIKLSLKGYTFPLLDRFVGELEIMLSDVYQTEISLAKIEYPKIFKNESKTDKDEPK
jgi:hypothetical protein